MGKNIFDNIKICVVGLGYVGLPIAVEFSKKYVTVGFDINEKRIDDLKNGIDRTKEVTKESLASLDKLTISNKVSDIDSCNVYIVTVPTPIDNFNTPDLSALSSASKMVGKALKKGDLVIYESTVYPGATEEICVPILEYESGLEYNIGFSCGYSPERINPGDKTHSINTITKVTSGSNIKASDIVDTLYKSIISAGTHKVSSIAIAEAAKVIENIQRDVNIALINELSKIFNKMGLDTNEVLEAAGSKWNFLPFRPGLVGGHCIGVDPYYLTHKSTEIGYHPEIILAGRRINDSMGKYIADCTIMEMSKAGINPVNARVAVFGLTFKENCPDLRNTKVISIIKHLENFNCEVIVTDPNADVDESKLFYNIDLIEKKQIKDVDAVIIAVAHDNFKTIQKQYWNNIFNSKGVLIDVKSIFTKDYFNKTKIVHWRL
jgi:UDP-N-acetyl-D-glucosamine/UDP-N-acetyl-D-galactosamine dehydrogenase